MPAFTQIGALVNISVMQDTVTLYPAPLSTSLQRERMHWAVQDTIRDVNPKRCVKRDNPDHELYHQDAFNREELHFHLQLRNLVDEIVLNGFLSALKVHGIISPIEHTRCLVAYHRANHPSDDAQSETLETLFYAQMTTLETKAWELRSRGHTKTKKRVDLLIRHLTEAFDAFSIADKTAEKRALFQEQCSMLIEDARSDLDTHRGFKQIFSALFYLIGLIAQMPDPKEIERKVARSFRFFRTNTTETLTNVAMGIEQVVHAVKSQAVAI